MNRNVEPLPKPPWDAKRELMIAWVNQQLDDQDAEAEIHQHELDATRDYSTSPLSPAQQRRLRLDEAIRRAHKGDVGLLRRLLGQIVDPRISEFIHPPKRPRGRRRSYPSNIYARYAVSGISDDVKRVRALWKANYDGQWKRRRGLVTAEEIVAERRGWTEEEVVTAIKLLSR